MLTGLVDLQRAALAPWLALARDAAEAFDPSGVGRAVLEHALSNAKAGDVRPDDLEAQVASDLDGALQADLLEDEPFYRLFALQRRGDRPERRLLLISPYSGYATRVLSPLVAALIPDHEILLVDWRDARLVPLAFGPFDLEDQIQVVERLLRAAAPAIHVIGLSQSTVPVLAAVARVAARDPHLQPRTMTLLGGPIVPAGSGLDDLWLPGWNETLDLQAFRRVPPPWPGAGREVYPSLHQLLLITLTHPELYLGLQVQALVERVLGRPGDLVRSLDEVCAVIDTPAELVRQTIYEVFQTANLAKGTMMVADALVDPSTIDRTALLTIEAGLDALVGRGDTHRAGDLMGLEHGEHQRVTLPCASHPDLFTGPCAASTVAPLIRAFTDQRG